LRRSLIELVPKNSDMAIRDPYAPLPVSLSAYSRRE
jgi:hypothetical protein